MPEDLAHYRLLRRATRDADVPRAKPQKPKALRDYFVGHVRKPAQPVAKAS